MSLSNASAVMEDLLRRLLCIDSEDTDMATLFMSHGVQVHATTFQQLLNVLHSSDLCSDKLRMLRRHPKILKVLHLEHSQCCTFSEEQRGILMKSFMRRVPSEAIGLVHRRISLLQLEVWRWCPQDMRYANRCLLPTLDSAGWQLDGRPKC